MNKEAGLSLESTAKKDKNPAIFFLYLLGLHNEHFYLTPAYYNNELSGRVPPTTVRVPMLPKERSNR